MGQRLLLVDSDRSFLKEHQVSLEAAFDLEICPAPDGVLGRLEQGAYAAVLICVEVAENKGYALCSAIRKSARLADLKVALISAKATDEEYRRHQSLKGRADLYLHKPIAPSALVAALTPLVPGRTLDPDNPLGELVDTELGDDWLDGLKASLEEPVAAPASLLPPAPPRRALDLLPPDPSPHSVTLNLEAKATAPPDTTRTRLLEEQVAALHEELRVRDRKLQDTAAELQQLQRQLSSVTQNLDEMERRRQEAEALAAKLAEAEAALRRLEESGSRDGESLRVQLKETLTERTDLLHQVEELNLQLSEKTQRTIELLKERDRLQQQALDLEPLQGRVTELEAALGAREQALAEAKEAEAHLNASLEGLVLRHQELEGVHQAALLDAAGHKERAHTLQLELAGLEATMRGQGRELAEVSDRLRAEEVKNLDLQAALAERERDLEGRIQDVQRLEAEVQSLEARAAEVQQRLDEATIQHEGERLELMNGLDQKEAELVRMAQVLQSQQEVQAGLEGDKRDLQARLAEHQARLDQLGSLLDGAADQLRRGADLARS